MSIKKTFYFIFLSGLFLVGIFFYQNTKFNDGKLHVVFCDVGEGDAIYIRTPERKDILIDGGPNDSVLTCLSNHMPFYDRELELVVLSHPHADHLVGLISVLKRYKVDLFATQETRGSGDLYNQFLKELTDRGIKPVFLSENKRFVLENGVTLLTEWPPKDFSQVLTNSTTDYFNQNESSLIELLKFGNFSTLLTGDAGLDAEESVAGLIGDLSVLKVSHHGSKTGTNQQFLEEIKPELAVISVGKNNRYNLPYKKTIEALNNLKIKTLRTDLNGEIEIVSDGKSWRIEN